MGTANERTQQAGKRTGSGETTVLSRPAGFRDETWSTRIERARDARSAARELRRGKPATYPTHLNQP